MLSEAFSLLSLPGSVGIIPTDTVYGIIARASDKDGVKRLYELKKRDSKPGTLIASSIDQLVDLGLKKRYLTAVEGYWPGPLSVVIPTSDPALEYLHQGKMSLAVRLPNNPDLIKLLNKTGPLLTSSANLPSQPPANTIKEAKANFSDKIDFYVDGGDLSGQLPSTIIRVVDDTIEILRPGAVDIDTTGKIKK
jgi:L-threonylcarbamoyladenylate synthase